MAHSRSFDVSVRVRDMLRNDILQLLEPVFPVEAIASYESSGDKARRDRVFTDERTLLTMVATALQEDRSLRTSVGLFQDIFRRNCAALREEHAADIAARDKTASSGQRVRGRPRIRKPELPKSKSKDISSNTAAFSKARDRLDQGLIDCAFAASRDFDISAYRWYGRSVFNTDGTYFQMQDAAGIPEKYRTQKNADGTLQGYPQGLLQLLTQHGSGAIHSYRIGGRDGSELDMLCSMLDDVPPNSLLLADDHYNCFAFYHLLLQRNIDIIVPDKKNRNFRVVRRIAPGDEIVEIKKPKSARKLTPEQQLPENITMRRICYQNSKRPSETRVLYTTILDKSIKCAELIQKYTTRWDVEVSIKEIKTIMGINIVRAKSEKMVFREIGVALLAYNLIRKIIAEGALEASFPPKEDIFQVLYSAGAAALVDCKGRVCKRWSPGRPPATDQPTQGIHHPKTTGKKLPKKN